jgi:NAD(P)H-hydrate repair Nnr-like enzyme with NAD(P)H-hydrate dehydratase domain
LDLDSLNNPPSCQEEISEISSNQSLKNFKILIKGEQDIILGSDRSFIVRTEGGKKRCGGMGDILAGVTAACGLWDY